jgi:RNAse (barnase) inhibitor barstar
MAFVLEIDGAEIKTEAAFHEAVKQQSGVDWYGRNLDALDEMLSFIIACEKGPFRIVWKNADLSIADGTFERYDTIVRILKEAEERFPDRILEFSMTFAEAYWEEGQDPFARMTNK